MAPAEGNSQIPAGPGNLLEDRLHHFRVRLALGQKQSGQKPAGRSAHRRDVIGIDLDRIPADLSGGKCDRIGFGNQISIAKGNDRGVFADSRFDHKPGIRFG